MPIPLSWTVTVAFSPAVASVTLMVPGAGVYFTALSRRIHSNRCRLDVVAPHGGGAAVLEAIREGVAAFFGERTGFLANRPDHLDQIDRLEGEPRIAGIGARQGQHVFQQAAGLSALRDNLFESAPAGRIDLPVSQRQFRGGPHERHGTAKLMRSVAGESLDLVHRRFQAGEHVIVRFGKPLQLVAASPAPAASPTDSRR